MTRFLTSYNYFLYRAMSHSVNKTTKVGVAVILAVVFAMIGMGVLVSSELTTVLDVDSQSEWQNNGTLNGLVATSSGELELDSSNTSGNYVYDTFDNQSDVTRASVYVDIPEPDNSSVTLVVDSSSYELSDGTNNVDVSGGSSYELQFQRDSTNITSPSVASSVFRAGETGSILWLVGTAAFGLLILLVVVSYLNVDVSRLQ